MTSGYYAWGLTFVIGILLRFLLPMENATSLGREIALFIALAACMAAGLVIGANIYGIGLLIGWLSKFRIVRRT